MLDAPSWTLPYDHALSEALARRGHRVHLLASPFMHGPSPVPSGYVREDVFLPRSSRLLKGRRRSRVGSALRGLEYVPSARRAREADRRAPARRRPRPVARHPALRPPLAARACGGVPDRPHRPRGAAAAHGAPGGLLAGGLRRRRPRRRPLPRLGRAPGRPRRRPGQARRDPAPGLRLLERDARGRADGDDAPLLRPHPRVQGSGRPHQGAARGRGGGAGGEAPGRRRRLGAGRAAARPGREPRRGRPDRVAPRLRARRPHPGADGGGDSRRLPYRRIEASGVFADAVGHGRPAVVSDVGAIGEAVRRFGAGEAVPPEDPEALAAACARLLGDESRSPPRSRASRPRAGRSPGTPPPRPTSGSTKR